MGDVAKRVINEDGIAAYQRNYQRGLTYARNTHKDVPLVTLMAVHSRMCEEAASTNSLNIHDRAWRDAEIDVLGEMIRAVHLLTSSPEEDDI